MNFDITELFPFKGSLIGFSGEPEQVLGHLPMVTNFSKGKSGKSISVKYLNVNVVSPYNIIIGRPSFNALEATFSTMYLTLKYPLKDGRVGIIKTDQEIARKYYKDSLELKKGNLADESVKDDQIKVNSVNIDPREDSVEDSLMPIEDVKTIHIGVQSSQTTQISSNLSLDEESEIIRVLRQNLDLFALKPYDMPYIDPMVVCHHLALDPTTKPITLRKREEGEEKKRVVEDGVGKLMKVDFIKEIRYPTWLANIVMVKKKS